MSPMDRAIAIAATAEQEEGALPYGAVVVRDGEIIGEGLNRALALHDPTSHGEVEAIRDACRKLGTTDLSGAIMYTSAEPCSMCVATMLLAGIQQLVYAADSADSAAFMQKLSAKNPTVRRRFSMAELREQVGLPSDNRPQMPSERQGQAASVKVFESFVAKHA